MKLFISIGWIAPEYNSDMATMPNLDPTPPFLTAEELLAMRGTPEFEIEFRRQMLVIAEHDRHVKPEDRFSLDWEAIDKVWK